MPRPGRDPPELPQWLQIPYLVPVKGVREKIILQGSMNSLMQPGDPLHATINDNSVGTLGAIMISRDTYFALTAGHILNDGDLNMVVRRRNSESAINLKIASQSIRDSGRPVGILDDDIGFQDDCAFLLINGEDIAKFDHSIVCLDSHFYNEQTSETGDGGWRSSLSAS